MLPILNEARKLYGLCFLSYDIFSKDGFRSFKKAFLHYLRARSQYWRWIEKNEPNEEELSAISVEGKNFNYRPKISIIMPTFNTDELYLRAAIESVLKQTYDNWELCIADGGSTVSWIKTILEEYVKIDSRIKVVFLKQNRGIAGNSNRALALANGEFVGFLDHDDAIAPFTFYEIIKILNMKRGFDIIYSDEDKIDEHGRRSSPFFKPDWSQDMFLSCNYPIHITILRKKLLDDLHGFKEGYNGSQDYDLLLRATEVVKETKIAHIPKVLYHWRTISTSTAASSGAKPYAYEAAKKALADAMYRRGIEFDEITDGLWQGSYRIKYKIIGNPRISIIIPTKDKRDLLERCIDSIIMKTAYLNYEILLIDNQSRESETFCYYNELKKNQKVRLLYFDDAFNYSAINNFAVSNSDSEFILFLNNDTEVISPEWLGAMIGHIQRPEVGAVGAKLLFPSGLIQHCGVILGYGDPPIAGHHYCKYPNCNGYGGVINTIRNFSAVTGACMMTKRSLFVEVGGLDEKNLAVSLNDVDYCLRLRERGYHIVYTPYATLYHHESMSRGYDDTPENKLRFQREIKHFRGRWGAMIDNRDPYYNPNLSLDRADFSIRSKNADL